MRSDIQHISELLYKYCSNQNLNDEEQTELENWLDESQDNRAVLAKLEDSGKLHSDLKRWLVVNQEVEEAWKKFSDRASQAEPAIPAHRIHRLKATWFRYAAAVILMAGVGAYVWMSSNNSEQAANGNKPLQVDIAPGGQRAVLTLADGSQIVLDSAADGALAQQGNAQVVKLSDGQITYKLNGVPQGQVMMNTMFTPRGGQYQLTLPDGTRVWLNAASSITFPTVFTGKERKVAVTGEAYFEVTAKKRQPFIVDVAGSSQVEVLGTSFNVNSYDNEVRIKTTLIEGKIKFSADKRTVVLQAGQQAQVSSATGADRKLTVVNAVDIDQVLAWKNGLFSFTNASFESVMRQFERWYDIKVQFMGKPPTLEFTGDIQRNLTLSQVIETLTEIGVNFKVEGRTLLVSGDEGTR